MRAAQAVKVGILSKVLSDKLEKALEDLKW